jgi:hypothetical protein
MSMSTVVILMKSPKLMPTIYHLTSQCSSRIILTLSTLTFLSLIFLTITSSSSSSIVSITSLQQVIAQPTGANATSTGQQQLQEIAEQGIVTSSTDPLPGHETHQSATLLRLRNDNAVYTGTVTFTSSKPVEVQVLHRSLNTTALPAIDPEFGTLGILPLGGSAGTVTISNLIPEYPEGSPTFVATVPFSGNAVSLHNIDGDPFVASYSVAAEVVGPVQRTDEISPAASTAEAETLAEAADEEEEDTPEEDDDESDGNGDDESDDESDGTPTPNGGTGTTPNGGTGTTPNGGTGTTPN